MTVPQAQLQAINPILSAALPLIPRLARRVNWRIVALGVVAGSAAWPINSMLASANARKGRTAPKPARLPELHRWENEGGMIAAGLPPRGRP
ncbi:MAG: hypothetical protein NVS9B10_23250 [Nevskia sp.]